MLTFFFCACTCVCVCMIHQEGRKENMWDSEMGLQITPDDPKLDLLSLLWFCPSYYRGLLYNPKCGILSFILKKYGKTLKKMQRSLAQFWKDLSFPIKKPYKFQLAVLSIFVNEKEVVNKLATTYKGEDERDFLVFMEYLTVQHQLLRTSNFTEKNATEMIHNFVNNAFVCAWLPRSHTFMKSHSIRPKEIIDTKLKPLK